MRIYTCGICGFEYDEAQGDPGRGIAPGTKWEDLPEDWVCPICGADKSMFTRTGGAAEAKGPASAQETDTGADAQSVSMMENAALCSNLARGCDKQFRPEEAALFKQLADWFEAQAVPAGTLATVAQGVAKDVAAYPGAFDAAREAGDRGSLRALTWGEKVTKIQGGLLKKAEAGAEAAVSGRVFVCEACGFIFVGDAPPDICPVCKVPAFKFTEVKRGA